MPIVTLPDGSKKEFEKSITIDELSNSIGAGLAKATVAGKINGILVDASEKITEDSDVIIVTNSDPEGLEIIRHSCAHLFGHAIKQMYPKAKMAIGPTIDDGFYYDIDLDVSLNDKDLELIEARMRELANTDYDVVRNVVDREQALKAFKDRNEDYKIEIINEIPENEIIALYHHNEYTDMCRGPHVTSTRHLRSFKLMKIAGAYWRGIETNPQLQRIYGTAWFNKDDLDNYLKRQEEAEKRDHRKLGNELDLFISTDETGPGQFLWKPKGAVLRQIIEDYSKKAHSENGYDYAYTPHIGRSVLWETSGHLDYYKEGMFPPLKNEENDEEYYLKPMNCPFHILIYKSDIRSYKELPLRYFELGSVYRYEKSGVLHGLLRARGFTQDDAHIFCTTDQIEDEILNLLTFSIKLLKSFGFDSIEADLSTRPEKSIGNNDDWEKATNSLKSALENQNISYVTAHGEGAFYGPKIDLHVKDAIGRRWQLSTIQVDFAQPNNFDLQFVDSNNKRVKPVMIHRALLGSIERFTGILIENYAGEFPGWLSPVQVKILTIGDVSNYVNKITKSLKGFRYEVDDRNLRLGEKLHDASKDKVPISLIVGEKDELSNTLAINIRSQDNQQNVKYEDAIKQIKANLKTPIFKI